MKEHKRPDPKSPPYVKLTMSHISGWTQGVWYLEHNPKKKNPKFEARNTKQIRISNVPNSKPKSQGNAILVILAFVF